LHGNGIQQIGLHLANEQMKAKTTRVWTTDLEGRRQLSLDSQETQMETGSQESRDGKPSQVAHFPAAKTQPTEQSFEISVPVTLCGSNLKHTFSKQQSMPPSGKLKHS